MNAESELAKTWGVLPIDLDRPIHLRAIWPKGWQNGHKAKNILFTPAEYPEVSARKQEFADTAIALNDEGYNIYTCVNPIHSGHPSQTVADPDIAFRRRILIDIDRAGALTASATDAEIEEAEKLADKISGWVSENWDVSLLRVMSGNGVHLYIPLEDVPNDDASHERCKRFLKWLAARFNSQTVKVDTTVANAAQITKVPGTIMRKGPETADRPYRMARVV